MKKTGSLIMSGVTTLILIVALNNSLVAQVVTHQEDKGKSGTLEADLLKAKSVAEQGNTDEALEIYLGIMETHPDNRDAVQWWIILNAQNQQAGPEGMIKSLEQLQELYPSNTGILFWKAFMEASTGQNEAALKDIDELIKVQPDTALHYVMKGEVLYAMEEYKEAADALEKATSLDSKRLDVWGMKAAALAKSGKYDDAIISVNQGLKLAPDDPGYIYNRACIYCLKGDEANALADLEKAISLNPSFKGQAPQDEDFKNLYDNEEFKKLTLQ